MTYEAFLASKRRSVAFQGLQPGAVPASLFPFQRRVTEWAITQGRAALWLNTGMGKTACQLTWAQHVVEQAGDVLIFCPLAVAAQTHREGHRLGIATTICRSQADVRPGINLVNYERLHLMDMARFHGVVLDESGILKAFDGTTRQQLTATCATVPYRLCCSATPAPNDHMELGSHAEFLGVCTQREMLSEYFVHDGGSTSQWRLKKHAVDLFWQWVATWGVALMHPRQLGDDTPGYDLPPLTIKEHPLPTEGLVGEMLFAMEARTLSEQRAARRAGLTRRVEHIAAMVNASEDPWIVWADLNDEADALESRIPGSIQVAGRHSIEEKEALLQEFSTGEARVLVSKPSICAQGLNWQHCAHMAFVGVSHSYESWYQAIRRCYRFGQRRAVEVHLAYTDVERPVVDSLKRKEADAARMHTKMAEHLLQFFTHTERAPYAPAQPMRIPAWIHSKEDA